MVYIDDLSENLESVAKLFADNRSLFYTVNNTLLSPEIINNSLIKISEWAYQQKMSFDPDPTKQAQDVIFSRKSKKIEYQTIYYNDKPVAHTNCQKHLGMYLDEKLYFLHHIKEKNWKLTEALKCFGN